MVFKVKVFKVKVHLSGHFACVLFIFTYKIGKLSCVWNDGPVDGDIWVLKA